MLLRAVSATTGGESRLYTAHCTGQSKHSLSRDGWLPSAHCWLPTFCWAAGQSMLTGWHISSNWDNVWGFEYAQTWWNISWQYMGKVCITLFGSGGVIGGMVKLGRGGGEKVCQLASGLGARRQTQHVWCNPYLLTEMQKPTSTATRLCYFFPPSCANFWAVYGPN